MKHLFLTLCFISSFLIADAQVEIESLPNILILKSKNFDNYKNIENEFTFELRLSKKGFLTTDYKIPAFVLVNNITSDEVSAFFLVELGGFDYHAILSLNCMKYENSKVYRGYIEFIDYPIGYDLMMYDNGNFLFMKKEFELIKSE